jgi:hypothetical protein
LSQKILQFIDAVIVGSDEILLDFDPYWTNVIELFHAGVDLFADVSCSNALYEVLLVNLFFQRYLLSECLNRLYFILQSHFFFLDILLHNLNELFVLLAQNRILVGNLYDHDDFD